MSRVTGCVRGVFLVLLVPLAIAPAAAAAEPAQPEPSKKSPAAPQAAAPETDPSGSQAVPDKQGPAAEPAGAGQPESRLSDIVRLTKDYDLWIDTKRKLVIVDGQVCLRQGQLEMFACPEGTKEHESVVALNCKSQYVHAALLAVGAEPGRPVQWNPTYRPATGTPIEIQVFWTDESGKRQKTRAQNWVKHAETGKAMQYDWVFAGSSFFTDQTTGRRYYQADGGDLICVSNFPSATLDLPVRSSQANDSLLFTAFTENIPPVGTNVRLFLIPKLDKPAKQKAPRPAPAQAKKDSGD